eukprot:TRINITY_DN8599_c0_g1_i1.p1 TRINITY_DN8599_c0_g1~~TRINITY_DN8599_c0_g1_i1.p1  ORF type:complete len:227 (+),score=74.36 TRINITY_DN8599_c0_g1_i1:45-683(+)
MNEDNEHHDEEMIDDDAGQREEFESNILNEIADIKNMEVDEVEDTNMQIDEIVPTGVGGVGYDTTLDLDDGGLSSSSDGDGCDPITMITVKDNEVQSEASDLDSESGLSSDSEHKIEQKEFLHMSMNGFNNRVLNVMKSATDTKTTINPHTNKYMSMATELFVEMLSAQATKQVTREGKRELDYQHVNALTRREPFGFLKVMFAEEGQKTLI